MGRGGKMGVHLDVPKNGFAGRLEVSAAQFAALFEGLDWRLMRPERRRSPQLAG